MSLYFLSTALFYLCGFSSPCLQPSVAILMGEFVGVSFIFFSLELPSALLEEGMRAAGVPELFAVPSQRRRERKMNASIYAEALMMVGKGKYVNKEPLFASAETRQLWGSDCSCCQVSLPSLLTFCAALRQPWFPTRNVMDKGMGKAAPGAGKSSARALCVCVCVVWGLGFSPQIVFVQFLLCLKVSL